jgi:hypothetical protein
MLKWDIFGFFPLIYVIQNCFICRSSDSIAVLEDAGIELKMLTIIVMSSRNRDSIQTQNATKYLLLDSAGIPFFLSFL